VNPVINMAAESVTLGWLLGIMTVFFLVAFLGWVWWAYTPRHKEMLEKAAMLPFTDGDET
jgi:cbb3-type cytochrome oxidase subunit 3